MGSAKHSRLAHYEVVDNGKQMMYHKYSTTLEMFTVLMVASDHNVVDFLITPCAVGACISYRDNSGYFMEKSEGITKCLRVMW